ncbi:GNAT family N-acetyltransferase [Rhodococcus sp. NPDC003348]
MIRAATTADLPLLPVIEVAAGEPFRALGMTAVADDAPPTVADLLPFLRAGRLWVATAPPASAAGDHRPERPVGYATAEVVDGRGHLEQVSVDPRWAGRRLGAALIDAVVEWATDRGDRWLTLTTFVDVPWNAPYYRRLGFEPIPEAEIGPGLRAVRAEEAAHGLDAWPRIAMRRHLSPGA